MDGWMCERMYICMYVCVCLCECVDAYTIYTRVGVCVCMCMYVCVCVIFTQVARMLGCKSSWDSGRTLPLSMCAQPSHQFQSAAPSESLGRGGIVAGRRHCSRGPLLASVLLLSLSLLWAAAFLLRLAVPSALPLAASDGTR